jgi:hypothetical protein
MAMVGIMALAKVGFVRTPQAAGAASTCYSGPTVESGTNRGRELALEFPAERFDVAPVDFLPVNGLFTYAAIAHSFPPGRRSWIVLPPMRGEAVHPS